MWHERDNDGDGIDIDCPTCSAFRSERASRVTPTCVTAHVQRHNIRHASSLPRGRRTQCGDIHVNFLFSRVSSYETQTQMTPGTLRRGCQVLIVTVVDHCLDALVFFFQIRLVVPAPPSTLTPNTGPITSNTGKSRPRITTSRAMHTRNQST